MLRPAHDGALDGAGVDVALHVRVFRRGRRRRDVTALRTVANAPVILAAYGEPNGIVEMGLRVGAADVLVLPQPPETLMFALRKAAIASVASGDLAKVVTVFSPKGGSGKTVLATNLAVAAQRSGIQTLLIDLDLQFGDAALTLAVPPRATIADLAASSGDIDLDKLKAFVSTDWARFARCPTGTEAARRGSNRRPERASGSPRHRS